VAERMHWLGADSVEQDSRLGLGAIFAGTDLAVARGVVRGMAVTQTDPASGGVLVGVGRVLNQASSGIGGAYLETLDAAKVVPVLSGAGSTPAESSPRRDLIVYESGLPVGSRLHVVKGEAGAIPVDPAVPAQAVALARVRVKAAAAYGGNEVIAAADIDDLRTYTALAVSADPARPYLDPPRAKVYLPTTIGLPNDSFLTFNQDTLWASAGMRSGTLHKIVIATPGIYDIKGQVVFASSTVGRRIVQIRRNASTVVGNGTQVASKERPPLANGAVTAIDVQTEFALAAGDHLELFAYQNRGSSLDLAGGLSGTGMSARWVAPLP
jgi:hypothetical protein